MNDVTAIATEAELDDRLSEPTPAVIETLGRLHGDFILLGVAGKMGPTLARMVRRASDAAGVRRRVIGVARFSTGGRAALEAQGVETIPCDLLDENEVAELPEAANVVFMAGLKFGATGNESATWAMNSYLPGVVCRKYSRSRIVVFSTGNVYGLTPVEGLGSGEEDVPQPVGEYAMSCLGRERVFEYFSRRLDIPIAIIRLNYACELRYGVLVDIARRVWAGEPIELGMGCFNTIWQGDANAMALRAFDQLATPPCVVNVTGPERLSIRAIGEQFGRLLGRPVHYAGTESATAFLSNARVGLERFGAPRIPVDRLMAWVADWVARGGKSLGKPTHFESRDGRY
jgi:nucleoside-diphosphate-sugar epimerase